ncbi:FadR/GntR family transcriptional regulator [Actinoallomurus sp. CA-150999]|uniref:FadR/GntR family transcriptional regulator n=1 Tax=Actinoallomurus sp. CA-150999 TaxID=3239887 RepID=UPI003D94ADE6
MSGEVARPTLSDALTERILELIRTDGLRPGDRLPSTRELSQRFAVTVPTLREVLRRLEVTGAIRMRHGSGIYVGTDLDRVVLPNPNVRDLRGERVMQLLETRLLIEPQAAELAARRAEPEAVARMRAVLAEAGRHLRDEDAELHLANMDFHRATGLAAGNGVLAEVLDSLLSVHAVEQREILRLFNDRARDFDEHTAILEAIERGDAKAARDLMHRHLQDVKSIVEQRLTP